MAISYFEPRVRELDSLGAYQCEKEVLVRVHGHRIMPTAAGHQYELFAACLQCLESPDVWLLLPAGLSLVRPFGVWMRWGVTAEDVALAGVVSGWCGTRSRTPEEFAAAATHGQLYPWDEGIRRLRDDDRFAGVHTKHAGHRGPEINSRTGLLRR